MVIDGAVTFDCANADDAVSERLRRSSSVTIPPGTQYRLLDPTEDCELLVVTLPADAPASTRSG